MELHTAIKGRRSIREFKNTPIPKKDIEKIIEMATWAPSGKNLQNWRFIVIEDREKSKGLANVIRRKVDELKVEYSQYRDKLEGAINYYTFFEEALVTIAIVATEYRSLSENLLSESLVSGGIPIASISGVSAAVQNLLLTAHSIGYGTCWMTGPLIAKKEMEEYLGVDKTEDLVAITPLGVPAREVSVKKRKKVDIEYI